MIWVHVNEEGYFTVFDETGAIMDVGELIEVDGHTIALIDGVEYASLNEVVREYASR